MAWAHLNIERLERWPSTLTLEKALHVHIGPLIDKTALIQEREAELALFTGAIGIYKNPASHRDLTIDSQRRAQEQVVLASLLLRTLDDRPQP